MIRLMRSKIYFIDTHWSRCTFFCCFLRLYSKTSMQHKTLPESYSATIVRKWTYWMMDCRTYFNLPIYDLSLRLFLLDISLLLTALMLSSSERFVWIRYLKHNCFVYGAYCNFCVKLSNYYFQSNGNLIVNSWIQVFFGSSKVWSTTRWRVFSEFLIKM